MQNLKDKFIISMKWNFMGTIARMILQIGFTILLTRMLSPSDFGLLAVSMTVIVIGNILSDFGLGSALIQKNHLISEDIRFVFTLQVILGVLFTFTIYLFSPWIATYFDSEKTEIVLQVLSSLFIIQSIGLTSISLLKKDLNFKKIQKIQIFSYISAYGLVGLPGAYLSYGVWSLVGAQIFQVLLRTILSLTAHPHTMKPLFNYAGRKYFLHFGTKNITNNILSWIIDGVNSIFIGHFLGLTLLGYFNRSLTLAKMPMDMITSTFQGILLPFYANIQHKKEYFKPVFLGSSTLMSLILFPIFLTVALIPETIILAMFGSKWTMSIDILTPIALAMPINTLLALGGPLLWANNIGEREVKAQLYSVILIVIVLFFLSQISLVIASWGVFISFLIRLFFINREVLRYIESSLIDYLKSIVKPLFFGLIVALAVFSFDVLLSSLVLNSLIKLLLDILFASFIYILLLYNFMTYLIDDHLLWLIEKNKQKCPPRIQKKLGIYS